MKQIPQIFKYLGDNPLDLTNSQGTILNSRPIQVDYGLWDEKIEDHINKPLNFTSEKK